MEKAAAMCEELLTKNKLSKKCVIFWFLLSFK